MTISEQEVANQIKIESRQPIIVGDQKDGVNVSVICG
jgi:hypothetical protein